MCVVSVAIVVSFHLKSEPSQLELRMAKPLGVLFWLLSLACLCLGVGNYAKTMDKYSRRMAIVQTGWKTQLVSLVLWWLGGVDRDDQASLYATPICITAADIHQTLTSIALAIICVCIVFLITKSQT